MEWSLNSQNAQRIIEALLFTSAKPLSINSLKKKLPNGVDIEEVIEDAKDVAAEVKRRAKNVKSELADVKKAAKELGEQLEDVAEAAAGKPRRGRKPSKGSKGAKKTTTRKKK